MSFSQRYKQFFALDEIDRSRALPWLFGVIIFGYFQAINEWYLSGDMTRQQYSMNGFLCWPHFQSCGDYYVFDALGDGYSLVGFYTILFILLIGACVYLFRRDWVRLHMILLPLFFVRLMLFAFLTYHIPGAYEYFHLPFFFLLLFARQRVFFLRWCLALLYSLSALVKFHESWILGSYFTSTYLGLPFIPKSLTPFVTNAVILFETAGSWLLLARPPRLKLFALIAWICFHVYSCFIVGFTYPSYSLPLLIVLFGIDETASVPKRWAQGGVGCALLAFLGLLQAFPYTLRGDIKLTQEAYKYGVGMIDANHQCRSTANVHYRDGRVEERIAENRSAHKRCPPYAYWFNIKQSCLRDPNIERVSWTFVHSINGGPFYELVNVPDACVLNYRPFVHNDWIQLPEDGAKVVGYPAMNHHLSNYEDRETRLIYDTAQISLTPLQARLSEHESAIKNFWIFLWLATAAVAARSFIRSWRNRQD